MKNKMFEMMTRFIPNSMIQAILNKGYLGGSGIVPISDYLNTEYYG
jgi:hypothetical protein